MERDILWTILLGLGGLCLFAALLFAAVAILFIAGTQRARRWFDESIVTPDPRALQARFTAMRARYPGLNDDALVQRLVTNQAVKAGLVGAVTGVGGVLTLPIAIPVDFALSAKIQAGLIHFVGQTYAPGQPPEAGRVQTYAILAGNRFTQQAMDASTRIVQAAVTRLMRRLLAETVAEALLKVVPFVGAIVGFVFNYAATRAVGELAIRKYRSKPGERGSERLLGSRP